MTAGRRAFLKKAGVCGLGTVGAVYALPDASTSAPESALDEPLDVADLEDLPEDLLAATDELDEEAMPFAVWQYKLTSSGYDPTSPINVVFVLRNADERLRDVMAVLEDAGWYRSPEEYPRYAWHYDRDEYVIQAASAAETPFGSVGRHHVRCWEIDGTVSMQTHADTSGVPSHGIASYVAARERVEQLFAAAGWSVAPAALEFGNEKDPDHDGSVTVITP